MRIHRLWKIGLLALLTVSSAAAQGLLDEQRKLLSKRAAEADAYRKLAETVYGLQINSRTYVRDFIAESDDIRSEVDTFVRGIRTGAPTWYEDGSCEVPADVTVAKVVETLKHTHRRHYKGRNVKSEDFVSITRRIEKDTIRVYGMGAPRYDLPPGLPEGLAARLALPAGPPSGAPLPVPEIWKKIGPQARMMATRSARLDAQRRLAERIKGLRLTSNTRVRDFAAESDVITAEMDAALIGAEEIGRPYYHSDALLVEVKMRVPTEQVVSTIKRVHARHYKGDDVKTRDIERITRAVVKRDFEAVGMGVPAARMIRRYMETTQARLPEWSLEKITVRGEARDQELDTPQGKLRAARGAELTARRRLADHIAGLRIDAQTLLRDFVAEHEHVSGLLDAVVAGALVDETRFTSETAIVSVSAPGMGVWRVVSEEVHRQTLRRK